MFSIENPLINIFSLFQVCFFGFQVWGNWKDARVAPRLGFRFLGRISVPRCWRGLSCDWRTRASQNLLHPQISTFPWLLSPWKAPSPTIRHLSKKPGAAPPVPLTMHLCAFSELQFPMAFARPCIYSSTWMALLNVSVENETWDAVLQITMR